MAGVIRHELSDQVRDRHGYHANLTADTTTVGEVLKTVAVIVEGCLDNCTAARWYLADHWQGLTTDERERVRRRLAKWLSRPAVAGQLMASVGRE